MCKDEKVKESACETRSTCESRRTRNTSVIFGRYKCSAAPPEHQSRDAIRERQHHSRRSGSIRRDPIPRRKLLANCAKWLLWQDGKCKAQLHAR